VAIERGSSPRGQRTKPKGKNIVVKISGGKVALDTEEADMPALTDADFKRMKRTPQVKVVRRALGLTQEEFADRFLIPIGTLRDWEQGRKEPDQAARSYLRVIATDPDAVQFALGALPKHVRGAVHKDPGYFGIERVWFVYRESKDAAVWGSVIVPRIASEKEADRLAKQFAEDEPGIRFGYGHWTPIKPKTAEVEYVARPNGRVSKVRLALDADV
jgi:putative transcriptional regulator